MLSLKGSGASDGGGAVRDPIGARDGGRRHARSQVSFSGKSAAVGVELTSGQGMLHFHGKDYPFKLQGLGLLGVGGSSFDGTGEVYHLTKVDDFGGSYAAASAAAALDQGELVTTMQNQHGVVMRIKSTTKGAELKAALEGVAVQLGTTRQ